MGFFQKEKVYVFIFNTINLCFVNVFKWLIIKEKTGKLMKNLFEEKRVEKKRGTKFSLEVSIFAFFALLIRGTNTFL